MKQAFRVACALALMGAGAPAPAAVVFDFEDATPDALYDRTVPGARIRTQVVGPEDFRSPFDTLAAINGGTIDLIGAPDEAFVSIAFDAASTFSSSGRVFVYATRRDGEVDEFSFAIAPDGTIGRFSAAFVASRIEFQGDALFDNLSIELGQGVPEPASWAMLLLGVGAVGASLRRRHARSAPAVSYMPAVAAAPPALGV